jgi:hypothetical protein
MTKIMEPPTYEMTVFFEALLFKLEEELVAPFQVKLVPMGVNGKALSGPIIEFGNNGVYVCHLRMTWDMSELWMCKLNYEGFKTAVLNRMCLLKGENDPVKFVVDEVMKAYDKYVEEKA